MSNTLHESKPRIIVAILPLFLKNLIYAIPISFIFYALYFLINSFIKFNIQTKTLIFWLIIFTSIIAIIPLIKKIINLAYTKYKFYKTHLVSEVKIINIKRQSVPYHQIINITVNMGVWNRIWNTGDLIIRTAEENYPNIILKYIKNPHKIESSIHHLILKSKSIK